MTCVIGAGAAGIATAYALNRAGIAFDWFEAGSAPGGLWRYDNDTGKSAVYASLKTNTSAPNMRLFGYQVPELGEDYLCPGDVVRYLDSFVDFAGLGPRLRRSTAIEHVEPLTSGGFCVTAQPRHGARFAAIYHHVVVANGRNWDPVIPRAPGEFLGQTLHALHYKTPAMLAGKRVVVAGFGNTGADIAVDAAGVARGVILSTRAGGHLSSRYRGGVPADRETGGAGLGKIVRDRARLLPRPVRNWLAARRLSKRGLSPKVVAALEAGAKFRAKPPIINDRIAGLIDADLVQVRPGIRAFEGGAVRFEDGSAAEADLVIWATGYRTSFPFFSEAMAESNGQFRDRYLRVAAPHQPGLYFVGHAAVIGPVFPVLEAQARAVAGWIGGSCRLPDGDALAREARRQSESARKTWPEISRAEDTVETYPYLHQLNRELRRLRASP
ncbi:MAG: NAD(P)-binding domain-containing protein [Bryobacteraceae bacterium]|jgi:cation diffusion facilitator CzcD-associated flavoprotein CzcO